MMLTKNYTRVIGRVMRFLGFGRKADASNLLRLLRLVEERSRTFERQLNDSLSLLRTTEERSRTLQHETSQSLFALNYQIDLWQRWYVESVGSTLVLLGKRAVAVAKTIRLETSYPIALGSNDHLLPDSTSEGIVRPTQFVRHCIETLGQDIVCLDLGTGSAGLVFEYIMNDVMAIGVEGSDHCRKNKVGYWPLLSHNLHTCDITHPFRLERGDPGVGVRFDVITMWEVLEHIEEKDLTSVLKNVDVHLKSNGYFIGSISLLEYIDANGDPYHVTLKPKAWWRQRFQVNGLLMLEDTPFNQRLFCRGNGPRFQDLHNYFSSPNEGFHFVARRMQDCERDT